MIYGMFNVFRWVLDMQCEGSRNFMDAFRLAAENDEEEKHGVGQYIIYLHYYCFQNTDLGSNTGGGEGVCVDLGGGKLHW